MNAHSKGRISGLIQELRSILTADGDEDGKVKEFLDANTFAVAGAKMRTNDLRERFLQTTGESEFVWTKQRFNRELRRFYPVRTSTRNLLFAFGVSFERELPKPAPKNPKPVIIVMSPDELKCVRIDKARHFYLRRNNEWNRVSCHQLRAMGLTKEQIAELRNRPVEISELLCVSQTSSTETTDPNPAQP